MTEAISEGNLESRLASGDGGHHHQDEENFSQLDRLGDNRKSEAKSGSSGGGDDGKHQARKRPVDRSEDGEVVELPAKRPMTRVHVGTTLIVETSNEVTLTTSDQLVVEAGHSLLITSSKSIIFEPPLSTIDWLRTLDIIPHQVTYADIAQFVDEVIKLTTISPQEVFISSSMEFLEHCESEIEVSSAEEALEAAFESEE